MSPWIFVMAARAVESAVIVLPASEDPSAWAGPAALGGFTLGSGAVAGGAVVELRAEGAGWLVRARDAAGNTLETPIATPRDSLAREDAVWLAGSLLRSLPRAPRATEAPSVSVPETEGSTASSWDGAPPRNAPPGGPPAPLDPRQGRDRSPPPPGGPGSLPTSAAPPTGGGRPREALPAPVAPIPTSASAPRPTETAVVLASEAPPIPLPGTAVAAAGTPSPHPATAAVPVGPPASAPPAPLDAAPRAASAARLPAVRPWVRGGAAIAWRPAMAFAGGFAVDGGVRIGDAWIGVGGSWLSPRDLPELEGDARSSAASGRFGVAWSPSSGRLAPWVGGGAALSWRSYTDGAVTIDTLLVPVLAVEAGAAWRIGETIALSPVVRLEGDLSETILQREGGAAVSLSPWEVGLALTLRATGR